MKMIFEEKETLKNMNNKYKTQFDELKEKVFNCQEMNHRLSEHVKTLDSRNSNSKYKISAMKKTVTDKQTEINNAQKYVVNKKEILEYHEEELNKLKSDNEELKEKRHLLTP